MLVKTEAQRAKRMFMYPSAQKILLLRPALAGKQMVIPMNVMKSKKVPTTETMSETSLVLVWGLANGWSGRAFPIVRLRLGGLLTKIPATRAKTEPNKKTWLIA